jgi:hypothetical protein
MNQLVRGSTAMRRIVRAVGLTAVLLVAVPGALRGQAPERPVAQAPQVIQVYQDSQDSRETRERLQQLLRELPPAVGEVLGRDPSLLTRPDYLAPYPALVSFLQQHPEIARNAAFFLGDYQYREPRERNDALDMFQMILAGMGVAAGVAGFFGVLIWVIRSLIDHRRWLRSSRVQAEVHTKLLDRLTTNEDLLTYIQSPAGRRFLESAPITLDQEPRVSRHPCPASSGRCRPDSCSWRSEADSGSFRETRRRKRPKDSSSSACWRWPLELASPRPP